MSLYSSCMPRYLAQSSIMAPMYSVKMSLYTSYVRRSSNRSGQISLRSLGWSANVLSGACERMLTHRFLYHDYLGFWISHFGEVGRV